MQSMDCFYQVESDWGGEEGPEERSERPKLLKKGKWGVKWVKTHWLSLTRLPLWIPALGFLPCHTDLRYTQSCVSFLAWEGAYYCTCTAWHYDPANRDMYPLLPKSFICICSWTVAVTPRVGCLCSLKFLGNFSSTYLLQLLRAGTVASFVLVQYLAQWVSWVGFLGVIAMITSAWCYRTVNLHWSTSLVIHTCTHNKATSTLWARGVSPLLIYAYLS